MKPLLISKIRGKDNAPRHYFRYQPPGQTGKKKAEREVAMRAGSDQAAAEREYRANIGLLRQGKDPYPAPVTLLIGKAKYLKSLENAPATVEGKAQTLDFFIGWLLERWEVETMADILPEHCETYQRERKPILSPASWRREVAYLRNWFKWAREQKPPAMSSNPSISWRAPKPKSSSTGQKAIITQEESSKLMAFMSSEVAAAWRFAMETGVRPGELRTIKVGQVRPQELAAIYIMPKTGNPRELTFSKELGAILAELHKKRKPSELAFTDNGAPWNRHSWRRAVYAAARKAELERMPNPHLARHTVATKLSRLPGMDVPTLMEIMGWDDAESAIGYLHANQGKIRSFFDQIQAPEKPAK